MVNRGELWWAESPSRKRRPYLVLTRQAAIPVLNTVLAVPATRTVRGIPTEVPLDADDGMPEPCALTLDNLAAMPKSMFVERISRLGPEKMSQVCAAMRASTGC